MLAEFPLRPIRSGTAYQTKLTPTEIEYLFLDRYIKQTVKENKLPEDYYLSYVDKVCNNYDVVFHLCYVFFDSLEEFNNYISNLGKWEYAVSVPDLRSFYRYVDILFSREDYNPCKYISGLEESLD